MYRQCYYAFQVGVDKLTQGFKDLSIPEILDSFSYFDTSINDIADVLKACGETRLIDDIKELVYEL